MRVRKLDTTRFGALSGHTFDFGDDVTVVLGPNEAGSQDGERDQCRYPAHGASTLPKDTVYCSVKSTTTVISTATGRAPIRPGA